MQQIWGRRGPHGISLSPLLLSPLLLSPLSILCSLCVRCVVSDAAFAPYVFIAVFPCVQRARVEAIDWLIQKRGEIQAATERARFASHNQREAATPTTTAAAAAAVAAVAATTDAPHGE